MNPVLYCMNCCVVVKENEVINIGYTIKEKPVTIPLQILNSLKGQKNSEEKTKAFLSYFNLNKQIDENLDVLKEIDIQSKEVSKVE